jgi:3-phosphoshikimate 1-carboxyvinyltransferase
MSTLLVHPQHTPLRGTITVPGDKSISHRAVMLAGIADGISEIKGWLPAGDTIATLEAMQALGVAMRIDRSNSLAWNLTITGRGLHGLQPPPDVLDCRNAGTCMRLLAGIMAGQPFPVTLDGSAQLRQRPMRRILTPLQEMGAEVSSHDGRAPLSFRPAPLQGIAYEMPVASAQVKSAVLLAGLFAAGSTRVYQPGPSRDHTERMLAAMGAEIHIDGDWITLLIAPDQLQPLQLAVPGDISSAAFPLVAAAIVPGSDITIKNVGLNETRTGLLDLLAAMGAQIEKINEYETGGEPAGDLRLTYTPLNSTEVSGPLVVRAIDEFPAWTVAATQAKGTSRLRDAAELRVKEVDRISVLAGELRQMEAVLTEYADGLAVLGPGPGQVPGLAGATVDCHGDHRLGMALAVAALVADAPTRIQGADCIADSFPGFVPAMQSLGAKMVWA